MRGCLYDGKLEKNMRWFKIQKDEKRLLIDLLEYSMIILGIALQNVHDRP